MQNKSKDSLLQSSTAKLCRDLATLLNMEKLVNLQEQNYCHKNQVSLCKCKIDKNNHKEIVAIVNHFNNSQQNFCKNKDNTGTNLHVRSEENKKYPQIEIKVPTAKSVCVNRLKRGIRNNNTSHQYSIIPSKNKHDAVAAFLTVKKKLKLHNTGSILEYTVHYQEKVAFNNKDILCKVPSNDGRANNDTWNICYIRSQNYSKRIPSKDSNIQHKNYHTTVTNKLNNTEHMCENGIKEVLLKFTCCQKLLGHSVQTMLSTNRTMICSLLVKKQHVKKIIVKLSYILDFWKPHISYLALYRLPQYWILQMLQMETINENISNLNNIKTYLVPVPQCALNGSNRSLNNYIVVNTMEPQHRIIVYQKDIYCKMFCTSTKMEETTTENNSSMNSDVFIFFHDSVFIWM